jgi:hypothetical protein
MKRWVIAILVVISLSFAGVAVGFRIAVRMLKEKVIGALGAGSKVAKLNVGWNSVELLGLEIAGPKGWPTVRTLEAERVTIVPSLRSLLTDDIEISTLTVEKPYLSLLRTPGKLTLVPSLLDAEWRDRKSEMSFRRAVIISKIELRRGVIEIFDATVSRPPLKTRLEEIEATIENVAAPFFKEKTQIELAAVIKGARRDGRAKVSGWVEPANRDSSSDIKLEGVDLVSFQPYLIKKGEARIDRGILDLDVKSELRSNNLDGKGKAVVKDLGFTPSRNYLDTFMGVPRNALISFLKDHHGAIEVSFNLKGDINRPSFSLNETLATRIASGMAGQLGVSIKGMTEGIETVGRKGIEGAAKVGDAVGSAVKDIFGGEKALAR